MDYATPVTSFEDDTLPQDDERKWLSASESSPKERKVEIRSPHWSGSLPVMVMGGGWPWLDDLLKTVVRLTELPPNWDSYGAVPMQKMSVARMFVFLNRLSVQARMPHVFPTSSGGIQLEWESPLLALEVEFTSSGESVALIEDKQTGAMTEGPLTGTGEAVRTALDRLIAA